MLVDRDSRCKVRTLQGYFLMEIPKDGRRDSHSPHAGSEDGTATAEISAGSPSTVEDTVSRALAESRKMLEEKQSGQETLEFSSLAPKKITSDLHARIEGKLEVLEQRTQESIGKIVGEKCKK